MMQKIDPKYAKFVSLALTFVSTAFTVALLQTFANERWEKAVFLIMGIGLQAGQSLLYVYFYQRRKGYDACLWAGLLALSLVCTIGAFSVSDEKMTQQAGMSDNRYQLLQDRQAQLNEQAVSLEQTISVFAAKRYFTKGVNPTREQLADVQKQQADNHKAMMEFTAKPVTGALYESLAKFFGIEPADCKFYLFLLFAIALDVVSVRLLALSFVDRPGVAVNPNDGDAVQVTEKPALSEQHVTPYLVPSDKSEGGHSVQVQGDKSEGGHSVQVQGDMLRTYVDALYPAVERQNGSLVGRRKIADTTGLTNKQTDVCHKYLVKAGIVRSEGKITRALMSKKDALEKLAG